MKIKQEHFDYLKSEINAVLLKYGTERLVNEYEAGHFARAFKTKDLQMRFCFDLLFGAGVEKWISDNLYPYMNDEHIYTALKRICPVVVRKY